MTKIKVLSIALSLLAGACLSTAPLPATTTQAPVKEPLPDNPTPRANPFEPTVEVSVDGPLAYQTLIDEALNDIDAFWADAFPDTYGSAYETVAQFVPYSFADGDRPTCGGERLDAEVAVGNAFYCPVDDSISWDNDELFPQLFAEFGDFAVALVLAHEWGHAIQERADVVGPTILTELQADCFAGAWVGSLEARGSSLSSLSGELDTAAAGFLLFRDPVGSSATGHGAHGNAFDRLGHFGEGLRRGASFCAELEELGVSVTETGFRDFNEQQSGGNLPAEDVIPFLSALLDTYWSEAGVTHGFAWDAFDDLTFVEDIDDLGCAGRLDTIGGAWCPTTDTAHLEVDEILQPLYDQFGDFGPGMILAQTWALKGIQELGLPTEGSGAVLRADCLVGDWASEMVDGIRQDPNDENSVISLSPGDLDEAIQSLLYIGGEAELSAFERVESLRLGFFGGMNACLGG